MKQNVKGKKFKFITLLFGLCFIISIARGEVWPLGEPTANLNVSNSVPLTLLRKIAEYEAKKTWGEVFTIGEIPCCGENGDVKAFMFVFQRGGSQPKPISEIVKEIKNGRKQYITASRELANARKEMYTQFPGKQRHPMTDDLKKKNLKKDKKIQVDETESKKVLKEYTTNSNESSISPEIIKPTESYSQAYEKVKLARNMRSGAGQFGALLISARYDFNPILTRLHGLPFYCSKGDIIAQEAKKALGNECSLSKIYIGGPLDQWFEFKDSTGAKILVDPFRLKTFLPDKLHEIMLDKNSMKSRPIQAAEKWSKLQRKIQEVK